MKRTRLTGGAVMKRVLDLCRALLPMAERQNTGVARHANADGRHRVVRYGAVGAADSRVIWPGGFAGEIECKATGELPTKPQGDRILAVNRAGGIAFWSDDPDTAERMILAILASIAAGRPARISYISPTSCVVGARPDPRTLIAWPDRKPRSPRRPAGTSPARSPSPARPART